MGSRSRSLSGWGAKWGMEGTRLHPLCSREHLNFLSGTPDCLTDCKITFFTSCLGSRSSRMRAEITYSISSSGPKSLRVVLHATSPSVESLDTRLKMAAGKAERNRNL